MPSVIPGLDGLPAPTATDVAFYSEILTNTEIAGAAISLYTEQIIDAINPMVRTLVTIFVILWGFALMRGMIDKPIQDTYVRVFKIAVIFMLALNSAGYTDDLTLFFWNLPHWLVTQFTPGLDFLTAIVPGWSPVSGLEVIDLVVVWIMGQAIEFGQAMTVNGLEGGTSTDIVGAGLYAFGGGCSGMVIAIKMVTKIALAIMLAITPFVILSILFEKTKSYFESWLSMVVNLVLTLVLLDLTLYLLFPMLLKTVFFYKLMADAQGGVLATKEAVQLMTIFGVYISIIRYVPMMASSITRAYSVMANGAWDNWNKTSYGGMGRSGTATNRNPIEQARMGGQ